MTHLRKIQFKGFVYDGRRGAETKMIVTCLELSVDVDGNVRSRGGGIGHRCPCKLVDSIKDFVRETFEEGDVGEWVTGVVKGLRR